MDSVALLAFAFSLLCLCISSGPGAAEPPPASTELNKIYQERKISLSSSTFAVQRDTIPIINPTTPSTTTPIINPSSPTPPMILSPTLATPTSPVTTPTTSQPPPIIFSPTLATPTSPATTPATSSGGAWCIANPSASQTALQVALDYVCGLGGADCSAIQSGGSCYDPNTVQDHASYAFNDYYQKNPAPTSCVFGGAAQLSYTDPSHGNCHYASSKTRSPATPTPFTPTPFVLSPPSPAYTVPGGPTVAGPTGLPSSADSAVFNFLVLLITNGLMLAAGYI